MQQQILFGVATGKDGVGCSGFGFAVGRESLYKD
jgi:hypothetical protein